MDMGGEAFGTGIRYYAYLFPVIIFQFFPAVTLIAIGIVLVRLSRNREILAMQVAGISLYRILLPVFIVTVVMSFASFGDQEWIIPRFAEKMETLKQSSFNDNVEKNLLLDDKENNALIRVWKYDKKRSVCSQYLFLPGMKIKKEIYPECR